MDTHELAWAAGFIDGEGSFFWNSHKRPAGHPGYGMPRFTVAQCDEQPILRLEGLFPFLRRRLQPRRQAHYRDQWILGCNGHEHVQQLLASLWPYLSDFKRDAALVILARVREQSKALPEWHDRKRSAQYRGR